MGNTASVLLMTTGQNGQEKIFDQIDLRRATAQERLIWGQKIKDLRLSQGMGQEELAEASGVTRRTLGSIERGDVAGQAAKLTSILRILGVESEPRGYSDFTEQQMAIIAPLLDSVPAERRAATSALVLRILAEAIRPARD